MEGMAWTLNMKLTINAIPPETKDAFSSLLRINRKTSVDGDTLSPVYNEIYSSPCSAFLNGMFNKRKKILVSWNNIFCKKSDNEL